MNSAPVTGQQAGDRHDGIQQDATGCCGVPQDAAEPGGVQGVLFVTDAAVGSPGYWQGWDVTPAEAAATTPV